MGTCFVIQPFDEGPFDKRYKGVLIPAITSAGLEPYRVDRDPSVTIPIDEIENGITNASVCLADITSDNPNVWFELGFAISANKDVVLICSDERGKFPFDVQHRKIIRYSVDSPQDFEFLKSQITERIKAILKKQLEIGKISKASPILDTEGLSSQEVVALAVIGENIDHPQHQVPVYQIRQDIMNTGLTKIAVTIALHGLLKKEMVRVSDDRDYNGDTFTTYGITEKGMDWLLDNQSKLTLRQEKNSEGLDQDLGDIDLENLPF